MFICDEVAWMARAFRECLLERLLGKRVAIGSSYRGERRFEEVLADFIAAARQLSKSKD